VFHKVAYGAHFKALEAALRGMDAHFEDWKFILVFWRLPSNPFIWLNCWLSKEPVVWRTMNIISTQNEHLNKCWGDWKSSKV
jgi:hypothetical protein